MKLLFLTNVYPPCGIGGYEQRCQEVAIGLARRGHRVEVLTSRNSVCGSESSSGETGVTRALHLESNLLHYRPIDAVLRCHHRSRANRLMFDRQLSACEPDIVFVWGMWNLTIALPCYAERRLPGRVVYSVGDYWPRDPSVHQIYWTARANHRFAEVMKSLLRRHCMRAVRAEVEERLSFAHVYCNSAYVRDSLVASGHLPTWAEVISPGIVVEPFLRAGARRQTPSDGRLRLLYLGGLSEHKGVHIAIEALAHLARSGETLQLTLIGDGHPDYVAFLREQVRRLHLEGRVHFVGRLRYNELPERLLDFDVMLFTSLWEEPFGRTILEAMASGVLVVGSTVGGAREVLETYGPEILCSPGNVVELAQRIQLLQGNPMLRMQLQARGRRLVIERYTSERMIDELEQRLLEVVGSLSLT